VTQSTGGHGKTRTLVTTQGSNIKGNIFTKSVDEESTPPQPSLHSPCFEAMLHTLNRKLNDSKLNESQKTLVMQKIQKI